MAGSESVTSEVYSFFKLLVCLFIFRKKIKLGEISVMLRLRNGLAHDWLLLNKEIFIKSEEINCRYHRNELSKDAIH